MLSPTGSRWMGGPFVVWLGIAVVPALVGASGPTLAADGYKPVWADEFDQDGPPNPQNWTYEHGFVRNDELQWYQPANARCEGGMLVIEARHEQVANPRHDPQSRRWDRSRRQADYSSASLMTRGRHEWLYGRFVMRGRIDTRRGLWPAFWTLGTARRWPGCGEIDVMEFYDRKLLANAAWLAGRSGRVAWDSVERPLASFDDKNWGNRFHEWRMDWDRNRIKLHVDDELVNEIDVAAAVNDDDERAHPFREPQYLLLNLAVGGTRGGDPSGTEFPARFEVDYVRVYQQASAVSEPE
ncbi:MAG: glycoside hydrolase family 16 protein [Pirellulales bacterium]